MILLMRWRDNLLSLPLMNSHLYFDLLVLLRCHTQRPCDGLHLTQALQVIQKLRKSSSCQTSRHRVTNITLMVLFMMAWSKQWLDVKSVQWRLCLALSLHEMDIAQILRCLEEKLFPRGFLKFHKHQYQKGHLSLGNFRTKNLKE